MNKPPDASVASEAVWPAIRVAEAIQALARHAGLPLRTSEAPTLPGDLSFEELNTWIERSADQCGVQADQAFLTLDEIGALLATGGPALIRLSALEGAPLLAVLGQRGRFVRVLGRDLRAHRIETRTVTSLIRRPFEAPVENELNHIIDGLKLKGPARVRARAAMMADRLKSARFRGCWLLRLSPGAAIGAVVREQGLRLRLGMLTGAYVLQYLLFVLSWWLLGNAILNGTIERGWLLGWVLLLLSLIPVRLAATWNQGAVVVAAGTWLRRRLLRGASRIDRQSLKRKGVGQLFGVVIEAAAIDALALSGGIVATFALLELVVACVVLLAGASALMAVLLPAWITGVLILGWRYFSRRATWTSERLVLSEQLLESMVGHRTRLVQQAEGQWHSQEDEALAHFIDTGDAMDRASVWLMLVPRAWLVMALAALIPSFAANASSPSIAISIGGALLAYRALQRLVGGCANLAGAVISARSVAALAQAATCTKSAGLPAALVPSTAHRPLHEGVVAQARDLTFRYRPDSDPILDKCSVAIRRHARVLLEGASGSGKTTLASLIAGLEVPDSGLLLIDGLDRNALGAEGWRARVTMAPQAHENYLVSGSLAFNLLMGRRWPAEPADLAEAERVCRELGLGDLLDRLPAGLHQVVGEGGWRLSQGERTRVFLARALLQRPELLVLDESFGALDSENMERSMRCVSGRGQAVLATAHL
jgi:ATP-binding cassette, subfamily B, bacterial